MSWYQVLIDQLLTDQTSYVDRALLLAVSQQLSDLEEREESLEGQLDGFMWSHDDE